MGRTRLQSIWHNMKTRCSNPNYDKYQYYGGKGVTVCDEWFNSFAAFQEWALSNGYSDTLTLERIDISGDYKPDNCKWISRKGQANNRSTNHMLTINGVSKTVAEWADECGISYMTLFNRINMLKWPAEKAISTPVEKRYSRHSLTYNGETHSLAEWSRITGLSESVISARINRSGWPVDKALTIPVGGRLCDWMK